MNAKIPGIQIIHISVTGGCISKNHAFSAWTFPDGVPTPLVIYCAKEWMDKLKTKSLILFQLTRQISFKNIIYPY